MGNLLNKILNIYPINTERALVNAGANSSGFMETCHISNDLFLCGEFNECMCDFLMRNLFIVNNNNLIRMNRSTLSSVLSLREQNFSIEENAYPTLDIIPDELFLEIFNYLEPGNLFTVARVAQRLKYLCNHPKLWRKIQIKDSHNLSIEDIDKLLRFAGLRLEILDLDEIKECDIILRAATQYNKKLRHITLKRCFGNPTSKNICTSVGVAVMLNLHELEHLTMHDTYFHSIKIFKTNGGQQYVYEKERNTYTGLLNFQLLEVYSKYSKNKNVTTHYNDDGEPSTQQN